jgi:DNA polymerase-1
MVETTLCLVDANSLFYRAFFAIKASLTTTSGQPTNAVFGFVKMVDKIIDDVKPGYIAVCFDVGKRTHRTEKFAAYKEHRAPMPDPLVAQVPLIKEVVRAYRFPIFEKEGFEADDVIATLVHRFKGDFKKIVIVSSDKDILQLVGGGVTVYNPYKEDGIIYTPQVVTERMGVSPERIRDLIALMGDASDNIPGAHGIGEKTARLLLEDFNDVEDLLAHPGKIKRESVRAIIISQVENIRLSRDLAILRHDVPLSCEVENLKLIGPDTEKLWDVFTRLEFKGFLRRLSEERMSEHPAATRADIAKQDVEAIEPLLKKLHDHAAFSFFIHEEDDNAWSMNVALDDKTVWGVSRQKDMAALFGLPGVLATGYDTKAARHFLSRLGIEPRVEFFDVLIAAYVADPSRSATQLENLLWNQLGLAGVSRQDYLGKEAHFLWKLKDVLQEKLRAQGLHKLLDDVEMPLVGVLFDMEKRGIAIDTEVLARLSSKIEKRLEKLTAGIYEAAGTEFNINSPKQLSEVLFQKLKLPVIKKTKTGSSTDEEVLTRLAQDHELPQMLLEYRQIAKLKTTYVDVLPALLDEKDRRIHTTFNQTGTETGRLSSSDPNLQNIPIKTALGRSIRQAFVAGDGFSELLSADYSQVELRILAHLSEDPVLISAFKKGADIHRFTASLIFDVKEKDVTDAMRENAKRVNFGIVYGMSAYGLAKDLGIDPKTAQTFIDEYFMRYPRVKAYLDAQVDGCRRDGFVATLLGRRRYIPEIKNANMAVRQFAERQAINAPIQGSAADLIKMAMIRIDGEIKKAGLSSQMVLQVHDELVFEVAGGEKKKLSALVRAAMENVMSLSVPLSVSVSVGKNWLETEELSSQGEK